MLEMRFMSEIPIDISHTLEQLLTRFQSVRHGLPELIKNAKDQYSALGIREAEKRLIVVLASSARRRLAVLDFAGARGQDFDRWREWSRRPIDRQQIAEDIEAGHGNGGKAFMVYGSASTSFFESVAEWRRTKMGFRNDEADRLFYPAYYVEDGREINDVPVSTPRSCLEDFLHQFSLSLNNLPNEIEQVFGRRGRFTAVQVNDVRDWQGRSISTVRRLAAELPQNLVNHPQAALTVDSCRVWYLVDGEIYGEGPLERRFPDTLEGFEDLTPIALPAVLTDPETEEEIDTGPGGPEEKFLQLRTSRTSLRMQDTKPLNVVRVRNERNVVDSWSIADLYSRAESAYILGELRVPALRGEQLTGAEWSGLADTSLVRAVRAWVADQIESLCQEIQRRRAREHSDEDLDAANRGLKEIRNLMRQFLEDANTGSEGGGQGDAGDGEDGIDRPPPPPPPLPGTRVDEVVLEGSSRSIAFARGTEVPLVFRALEIASDGEKRVVRHPELSFHSDPTGPYLTTEGHIGCTTAGTYEVWAVSNDTQIASNRLVVDVVRADDCGISGVPARLLLQGERIPLRVEMRTPLGPRQDLLVEASVDESDMGRINRHGVFTAGSREGVATVRVRYGDQRRETVTATLYVGEERFQRRGRGGQEGGTIPYILLCGTEVPGKEQYAADQRTHSGGDHYPTIIDFEPEFEDVIFVNPDSRESLQVRRGRGGRRGVMGIGTQTYLQFLALKCFEILKRLWVKQEVQEGTITELQFRQYFAQAETACAPFVEKAYDIAVDLTSTDANYG